jgi:photosystem II stability/assembly factor-like uncharacterized protein
VALPQGFATVDELVRLCPSLTGAVAKRRILLSGDGAHWRAAAEIPGKPAILGLAGIGCSGLIAATASGLMLSNDLGESWHQAGSGLRGTAVEAVAAAPSSGMHFAASAGQLYQSHDGGETWQPVTYGSTHMGRIIQILPEAGRPGRLMVLTEGHGVYECYGDDAAAAKTK